MTDKVFIIKHDILQKENISLWELFKVPTQKLQTLSDEVISPKEAIERFNNNEIDTEEYMTVYRENIV